MEINTDILKMLLSVTARLRTRHRFL